MPKDFEQCKMKNFNIPKTYTGEGMLLQSFKLIDHETTLVDPFICKSEAKMLFLLSIAKNKSLELSRITFITYTPHTDP